jgi:hypothetical protein
MNAKVVVKREQGFEDEPHPFQSIDDSCHTALVVLAFRRAIDGVGQFNGIAQAIPCNNPVVDVLSIQKIEIFLGA